jgi:peptide/nickel transport system permease protein
MRTDYFVRRALSALLVIVGVVTLTFFVARLVPSAPARLYAGARVRPAQLIATLRSVKR